ncbi:Ppx/GppA phosphatase family protein [Phenylobacterium sp.]|jgi:exopolyphosphatase/guanosine-5'-triphosphate,3'-diphosphate pyrophosphatase|uniref:Ppx/GppA phosphatase family protein n=1 Tax=Phenylobacterium sp. TaxID=1871053 RepID=UPI002F3EB314
MWPRAVSRAPESAPVHDAGRRAAVIDVGSNSVRLVVYRLEGRAIWTVFNEKALAGLGRDLPETGRLSPQGVETALTALRRYRAVLQGWDEGEIFAAATAAVREATDGPAFLHRAKSEIGFDVRLLSGEDEARYGALGVLAGSPSAEGVVGDVGGSSLELVRVSGGRAGDGITLPLGPFSLGAPRAIDLDRTRKAIEARIKPVAGRFASPVLHAVGGAWRNLALLHMEMSGYPLHVTHLYEMTRSEALDVTRFAARQSKNSLERIEGLSKKRFDTLPYAALLLETLIERLDLQRVVTSAYGVREGLLFESMTPGERGLDPLIAGCEALTSVRGLAPDLGEALEGWLTPAFGKLAPVFATRDGILLAAACRLSDLGARLHPDHRADVVFEQVLRAPVAGMNHPERAFLACALFSRHTTAATTPEPNVVARLLSSERRQRARALGAAIRLGCDLSGRNGRLLQASTIRIDGDRLVLAADPDHADMLLGEQTAKRAATLAGVLRLKLHLG